MVSSLPFLVVLDMCTGLARLDFGIVKSCSGGDVRFSGSLGYSNFLIFRW